MARDIRIVRIGGDPERHVVARGDAALEEAVAVVAARCRAGDPLQGAVQAAALPERGEGAVEGDLGAEVRGRRVEGPQTACRRIPGGG